MQKLAALAACAVCAAASAQQPSPAPAAVTNQMPEMVVTAARLPGQEQPVTKLPAHANVITTEQIERSPAVSVPDMLTMQPGLQNIDTTGFGLFSTPNMRGFGERSGVLVLVDGVRANDPGNSTANALWPSIPPQDIERIEIIRGGGSHIYGEGAIGGVINIITKKGAGEPSGEVDLAAGNFGYWRSHVAGGGSFGAGRAYGSGTYEEGNGHRDGLDFYKENARGNVGVTTAWGDMDAGVYFHKGRLRNPGALTYQEFHDDPEQIHQGTFFTNPTVFDNEITRLTFDWRKTFDSGFSFHAKPYVQNFFETIISPLVAGGKSIGTINQPSWGGMLQLDHVADVLGGQNHATLGGEWVRQDFLSVWETPGFAPFRTMVDYDTFSLFLQDALDVTEKLRLQAGVRYDNRRYRLDIPDMTSFTGGRIAEIHDLDAWSPSGGAVYSFTKTESAYFNISRSFKLPIGNDIGTATPEFQPNSDIEPISAMNYEVGFRWNPWREFGGSLALYHSDIKNDIQLDPFSTVDMGFGPTPWPQNANFDEVRNGVELALHSSPADWIFLFLNYTLQESRFEGGLYGGNHLPQVPQHILSGGFTWAPVKWLSWSWELLYAADQVPTNDLRNEFEQNDYMVVNTKLVWTPCKNARVYLAVNNVLDVLYENYPAVSSPSFAEPLQRRGYNPAPGLAVQGGVSFKF
jgi:iron complex outermembrane receptor protein